MNYLENFFKGIIIGIGGVAPGVSGGTFAVMLGVYDKLTDAIGNFYKDFKAKMMFLMSIGLGIGLGIIGFSNVMKYLFATHEVMVKFLFIGLMIGTLPTVVKEANKEGFKKPYLLPFLITFGLTVVFAYLDQQGVSREAVSTLTFQGALIYGGVIALGTIVPGISSSIILMYAGVYEAILGSIASLELMTLIPLGIGFGLTVLFLAKLINYLFKKFYGYTFYMVLGFVTGSIVALFPAVKVGSGLWIGLVICLTGGLFSYQLGRLSQRKSAE